MDAHQAHIDQTAAHLRERFTHLTDKKDIFKDPDFKMLYGLIGRAEPQDRPAVGKLINELKMEFERKIAEVDLADEITETIDPTAPFDKNVTGANLPGYLPLGKGSLHPLADELENALNIFRHMGFETTEARELDDEYHMFDSLNFPQGHPARDNWDRFTTDEGLVPIAHTTAMDNRLLRAHQPPTANVTYGRCFRNEDLDATHEHTFYQIDGIMVNEGITLGDLLGTFKVFFENFFGESLEIRTKPAYFPFVEPGLEYFISKPASLGGKAGEWLEVMGCGMLHPNVLIEAGIDPKRYTGFAWGFGLDRMVMLKYGIEDIRHFESARLEFLRKFAHEN